MAEPPNVRLHLANRPENVALVREMLTGVADAIELEGSNLNDIRTAVTEACNNVVLHAYEGEEGLLEIELYAAPGALEVVVRDHGIGIQPQTSLTDETAVGIGLPVIKALVHRVELREAAGQGTEVRMEFAVSRALAFEPLDAERLELPPLAPAELATTTMVALAPASLARAVLPRLLSVLAARAHFSTDRISDAHLVADALVAHAPRSIGASSHLSLAISVAPRDLEFRVGPLGAGRAQQLIVDSDIRGLGRVIEKLTDRHRVVAADPYEMLTLGLIDHR